MVGALRADTRGLSEALRIVERVSFAMRRIQKVEDLRRIEARMEKRLASLFREQGKAFLVQFSQLRGYFAEAPGPEAWSRAMDHAQADTREGFVVAIDDGVRNSLAKGATRFTDDLGMDVAFDLKNPRAVAYLEAHAGERIAADVDATTRKYIGTLVTQAADEGWSYDQTAKAITERYSQFAVGQPQAHIDSRAHLIATTEATYGYEKGNALMAQEMAAGGIPMEKAWLTVGDSHVDQEECGPNEEEGWIPAEATFQDGSSEPPAHPACRCTTQYQVAGVAQELATDLAAPPLDTSVALTDETSILNALSQIQPLMEDSTGLSSYWDGSLDIMTNDEMIASFGNITNANVSGVMGGYVPTTKRMMFPVKLWAKMTPEAQWETLIHEFGHSLASPPLRRIVDGSLEQAIDEGVTEGWLRSHLLQLTGKEVVDTPSYQTWVSDLEGYADQIGMDHDKFFDRLLKVGRSGGPKAQSEWIRQNLKAAGKS